MLTNRLKPHLENVIAVQQSGYVPGRFIGINIRKMIDLLLYLEREEIPAILMTVDFEKCFDLVDHEALYKTLQFFNVGEYFISWIRMVYTNFEFCVVNNGFRTPFYTQNRGLHQGCALSGPVFLFMAQLLTTQILRNKQIRGISIDGEEEKISQYADDTNLWSLFEEASVNCIIDELEWLYNNTGLKVNYEKSVIYRVGSIRGTNIKLKLNRDFKWSNVSIDTLGIIVNMQNFAQLEADNYTMVFEKAASIMNSWATRNATLLGKVTIINSLISSLFVYKMQVLPLMSKQYIARLNRMIADFIWNGKKPKIRLNVLQLDKRQGGRRLVDLSARDRSVKMEWVKRVSTGHDPVLTRLALYGINTKIKNAMFWECNLNEKDVGQLKCTNPFWEDVSKIWCKINFCNPFDCNEVENQIIWYNSHVKVRNCILFNSNMYHKGILYVKDLYDKGVLRTRENMRETYECEITQMEYNSLIDAIPKNWKKNYSDRVCKHQQ